MLLCKDYLFFNDAEPELDVQKLLKERCAKCHSLGRVHKVKKDRAGWEKIIDHMIRKGAKLNDAEREAMVEYLAAKK